MHTESVIISAVCSFFKKLGQAYEKSAYHKVFCRLFDVVGIFLGKFFGILFSVSDRPKHSHSAIFSKILNSFLAFFHRIFSGTSVSVAKKSDESLIVQLVNLVFDNWHLISVRNYSTVLLSFTLVRLAIIRMVGRTNDKYTLVFIIVSAIGMCIPASFAGLYQGSLIRSQLGLYDLKNQSLLIFRAKQYIATTCCLVIGALLGIAILLPYWHIFVLCVIGIVFVFTKPNLSALLIVAVSPFISINVFFVLAIILATAWILRYFALKSASLHIDALDACVIFIIITALCSAFVSPVIKSSINDSSVFLLYACLYFILRRAFTDKNNIKMFIDFIVIACGIIAFSLLSRLTFTNAVFDKDKFYLLHNMEQNLIDSAGSDKGFGELFAVVLPFAFCRMKTHKAFFGKLLYFASALLMSVCIFVSYKYCLPVLIVTVAMVTVAEFRRLASFMVLPSIIFLAVLLFEILTGRLSYAMLHPYSFTPPLDDGNFVSMLLCGVGFGPEAFRSAYSAVFNHIPQHSNTMSLYTSILLACGIVGIIIFAVTMWTVFSFLGRAKKISDTEKKPFFNAITISAIAFVMIGFLPSKTYCETVYMLFFTFGSMAGAMLDIEYSRR